MLPARTLFHSSHLTSHPPSPIAQLSASPGLGREIKVSLRSLLSPQAAAVLGARPGGAWTEYRQGSLPPLKSFSNFQPRLSALRTGSVQLPSAAQLARESERGPCATWEGGHGSGFGVRGAMPWNAHESMDPFQGLSNPFTQ